MVGRGSMVDRGGMVGRGGMVDRGSMVGRGGMMNLRVAGVSLVGDIGNITLIATSGVLDVLGPAVGKGNRVRSLDVSVAILVLGGVEGSLGVVISNSVLEGVGLGGLVVGLGMVGGCVVGRGGVDNGSSVVGRGRGMVGRGGVVSSSMDRGMDSVSYSVTNSAVANIEVARGQDKQGGNANKSLQKKLININ